MQSRLLAERFWEKVDRRGTDECWPWMAALSEKGYGRIAEGAPSQKTLRAHRVSYEMWYGFLTANLEVQHSCNNPSCCNPFHLSQDTHLVNMKYKNEQGRKARGENQGSAKLTEEQVAEIRRDYVWHSRTHGQPALARKYGVDQTMIGHIVRGENWKSGELPVPTADGEAPRPAPEPSVP